MVALISFYRLRGWRMIGFSGDITHIITRENNMIDFEHISQDDILDIISDKTAYNALFNDICEKFEYRTRCLSCYLCIGSGVVDWITKARGGPTHDPVDWQKIPYKISPNRERECQITDAYRSVLSIIKSDRFFIRTPVIPRGFEICPVCYGSGILISRFTRVIDGPSPLKEKLR